MNAKSRARRPRLDGAAAAADAAATAAGADHADRGRRARPSKPSKPARGESRRETGGAGGIGGIGGIGGSGGIGGVDRTAHRLGLWALWLLLLAVPFVLDSAQKDAFRLSKALLGETLALLSLFFLAFAWKGPEEWRRLARAPFVLAFGPFVGLATLLSLTSPHVAHVHRGLAGLWIGALAIWGWSVGFSRRELGEALRFYLVPASILAAVAILQFHGIYKPYAFIGIAESSRFAIGSLAGNVGDLAAALVLPAILAQAELARGKRVALAAVALALCLYGLIVTQTFSAIAGVTVGTIVFWSFHIPRRRAAIAVAAVAGALVLVLAMVGPIRERSLVKIADVARGDWNSVLTGRLDGWRAAVWMVKEHPLTGVGVGAFRTEFVPAKIALLRDGVVFFVDQLNVVFANAHNELLEVAAETGWPGLAAFLYGLGMLVRRLLRRRVAKRDAGASSSANRTDTTGGSRSTAALAWAGSAAVGVLSLANFPFRIAVALWPICLFVAWILSAEESA